MMRFTCITIFKRGKRKKCLIPQKKYLNNLANRTPYYIIVYSNHTLWKIVRFCPTQYSNLCKYMYLLVSPRLESRVGCYLPVVAASQVSAIALTYKH